MIEDVKDRFKRMKSIRKKMVRHGQCMHRAHIVYRRTLRFGLEKKEKKTKKSFFFNVSLMKLFYFPSGSHHQWEKKCQIRVDL